jgi:hypothetical protein
MKKHFKRRPSTRAWIVSMLAIIAVSSAPAASAGSAHSAWTRIEPYLMASQQQEIALARSAAPPSISMHATVMVLGAHGYVTAVKGTNGFVCLVQRPWDNELSVKSTRFWNRKIRSAFCYNAAAARSVLPDYLMRTEWVLAGASKTEIGDREKAAWAAGKLEEPAPGAMCYMMSKHSWGVGGNPGPWRPHLMFYFPSAPAPNWGANLDGTPVIASTDDHTTVFVVVVPVWSDGSPAPSF